jgi:hypothetical protein
MRIGVACGGIVRAAIVMVAFSVLTGVEAARAQQGVEVGSNLQLAETLARNTTYKLQRLGDTDLNVNVWSGAMLPGGGQARKLRDNVAAIRTAISLCDEPLLAFVKQEVLESLEYMSAGQSEDVVRRLAVTARLIASVRMSCNGRTYAADRREIKSLFERTFAPVIRRIQADIHERRSQQGRTAQQGVPSPEDILAEIEEPEQTGRQKAGKPEVRRQKQASRTQERAKTGTTPKPQTAARTAREEHIFEYTFVLPREPQAYTARIVDSTTGTVVASTQVEAGEVVNWTPYGTLQPGRRYELRIDGRSVTGFTPSEGQVLDLARLPATPSLQVAAGGTTSAMRVPQLMAGTFFNGITEVAILNSARSLNGGGGFISLQYEFAREYLALTRFIQSRIAFAHAIRFFMHASYNTASGSANGSVAAGTDNVAQTYIVPNPASGSTGILAGATGQAVTVDTSIHTYNWAAGIQVDTSPVPLANGVAGPPAAVLIPSFDIGLRYQRLAREDRVSQQSLTFADLSSVTNLDATSDFLAPSFGVGLRAIPTGPEGPFGSVRGMVAPGVLWTDASASQFSQCGPCGAGSPERDVSLRRDFDDSKFSVIAGVSAEIGYQFNPNLKLSVLGSYEYMSHVPVLDIPITPTEQPVRLDYGPGHAWQAGARLTLQFAPLPPPP